MSHLIGQGSGIVSSSSLAATLSINETPSGAIDGANATYTTSSEYVSGTLEVFDDGQARYDITELTSNSFQLGSAPLTGSVLRCSYVQA